MINSRSLDDLDPIVKAKAEALIAACIAQGIDLLVTSTYRDIESQNALYAQGRTTPGNIVTNATGGQSFHNYRVALDFCPLVNGKCDWNDAGLFERVGVIAEGLGMEWAGRWTTFRELAHVQYTQGLSLAQLDAGARLMPVA